MLRNTSSIPSAFRSPPTKNYLTDLPNTILSAIANVLELDWCKCGGSKPPPYGFGLRFGGKNARDTFGKAAAEGY